MSMTPAPRRALPAEIGGSFTIEQVSPEFRDSILGALTSRYEVMATFANGTKVYGWLDANDVEVVGDRAMADVHVTRMVDPDGTVHDFPGE